MDRVVFARDRAHIGDTREYEKLVRARNLVLRGEGGTRGARGRTELLDAYEARLAAVGARLWARRSSMLAALARPFAESFARVHGGADRALLRYESALGEDGPHDGEDGLREALRSRRGHDQDRGVTTVGPHRDDLVFELDGERAADFASQGQARALMLSFKLAELLATRQSTGRPPLLLLDDVSSELDEERSAHLFETLAREVGQCVLTTTEPRFVTLPPEVERHELVVASGEIREPPHAV
jgi:DNA replication and repair protein RecF